MNDTLRVDYTHANGQAAQLLGTVDADVYFDPAWYRKTYGAELAPEELPLEHYVRRGERENAWPSPHFDPEWYRQTNRLPADLSPLCHYLQNRDGGLLSPLPVFDAASYSAANPDWHAAAPDPYLHWLRYSQREGDSPRTPTYASVVHLAGGSLEGDGMPDQVSWETLRGVVRLFVPLIPFDAAWYCDVNPDVALALQKGEIASANGHFIEHGFFEGRAPAPLNEAGT